MVAGPSPSLLIFSDSKNGADMRHAAGVVVSDPFLYVEHAGRRHAVITGFEVPRMQSAGLEALSLEELGVDSLLSHGAGRADARLQVYARACHRLGLTHAAVPPGFPFQLAQRLAAEGIELVVDSQVFEQRRRSKSATELAGIVKAARAAETAMRRVRTILASASIRGSHLVFEGEHVTSELLRSAIQHAYLDHDVLAEDMIVAHGAQIYGHNPGSGDIAPAEPIVVDLAPRDPESGCYADMTRTFVVGPINDEIQQYHRLVHDVLGRATAELRPGVPASRAYEVVCEWFHDHGFPTELSKPAGTFLTSGFFHGLGHGIGLQVHEPPFLHRSKDVLMDGDVVAIEPGLYREGFGGCRLEDLYRITTDGAVRITDFPYELGV